MEFKLKTQREVSVTFSLYSYIPVESTLIQDFCIPVVLKATLKVASYRPINLLHNVYSAIAPS